MLQTSALEQVSSEERHLRVHLAAAFRLTALYGWDDLIFTHLSVRIPGPEHHFLINPYELMFDEITASSLVKIDIDGNPVVDTPYAVNPAGFTIHSAIHMGRRDAKAVMHLHTPCGQAVAAMSEGLMPHTQTAMIVRHDLAFHDYEGIATDLDERERLVTDLGAKHSMLLRNHGTLTVGETIGEAFVRMYLLERACQAQVHLLAAGRTAVNDPPDGVGAAVENQSSPVAMKSLSQRLAWPALLRKVDRLAPGYRD